MTVSAAGKLGRATDPEGTATADHAAGWTTPGEAHIIRLDDLAELKRRSPQLLQEPGKAAWLYISIMS